MDTAPLTAPIAAVDVPFLRRLANISESTLIEAMSHLAMERDLSALAALADLLEEDGFPVAGRLKKREALYSKDYSLAQIVAESIAPPPPWSYTDSERAQALTLIHRFKAAYGDDAGHAQIFVDEILFLSCGLIHDTPFAMSLVEELGANLNARFVSKMPGVNSEHVLLTEAGLLGNGSVATVLARLHEKPEDLVAAYTQQYSAVSTDKPTSLAGIAEGMFTNAQPIVEMLKALDERCEASAVAVLRGRILTAYLAVAVQDGEPWDDMVVRAVMGQPGSPSYTAMLDAATDDAESAHKETEELIGFAWRQLCIMACQAHCADVLEIFGERLKAQKKLDFRRPKDPVFYVCSSASTWDKPQGFSSDRMRATLELLVKHGHQLDRCEVGHPPAIHIVAKEPGTPFARLEKLKVLLSLGLDPYQKGPIHQDAASMVAKDQRADWEAIARSFTARKAVTDLIEKVDAGAAP